jgi:hypothetical protein
MKKNWKRMTLVASVTALSALMVFAGAAFAMGNGPGNGQNAGGFYGDTQPGTAFGNGATDTSYGIGVRGAWAGGAGSLVQVAADVMGIERTELVAELSEGISISDAADNHDVAVQDIVDAYVASRSDFLAQLVDAGRMTQEQADLMLAEMADNVLADLDEAWTAQGGAANNEYGAASTYSFRNSAPGQVDSPEWIDEDGDGQCDNYDVTTQGQAYAGGRGGRWNR